MTTTRRGRRGARSAGELARVRADQHACRADRPRDRRRALRARSMPKLGSLFDWRKAMPERRRPPERAPPRNRRPRRRASDARCRARAAAARSRPRWRRSSRSSPRSRPPRPRARGRSRTSCRRAELRAWFDELAALSVPEAVAKIRTLIAGSRRCVVIGLPFNDHRCLGSITEVIAELVENQIRCIVELAAKYATSEALAAWIRTLPQRDDDGDRRRRAEGRGVRAAAAAAHPGRRSELRRARGALHRRGRADRSRADAPARDARHAGRAAHVPGRERSADHPRSACAAKLPGLRRRDDDAGPGDDRCARRDRMDGASSPRTGRHEDVRNGPSRVRSARNAVMRLVDRRRRAGSVRGRRDGLDVRARRAGRAPLGRRALSMVRTTAHAIAELPTRRSRARSATSRSRSAARARRAAMALAARARSAGRIGLDVGAAALRRSSPRSASAPTCRARRAGAESRGPARSGRSHTRRSSTRSRPCRRRTSRVATDIDSLARRAWCASRAQGSRSPRAGMAGHCPEKETDREEERRRRPRSTARASARRCARLAAAVHSGSQDVDRLGARHRGAALARLSTRTSRPSRTCARLRARVARGRRVEMRRQRPAHDARDVLFAAIEIDLGIDSVAVARAAAHAAHAPRRCRACCAARARRTTNSRPS